MEKIKTIEEEIKAMKAKFTKDIESIKTQQALTVGQTEGSGEGNSGAAAAAALQSTVKKIEEQNAAHLKRMTQLDIKVQNALTDIQGSTNHFNKTKDQIFRNMTHIGNVRNEVNIQLNSMQNTLSSLQEGFEKNGALQRK